MDDYQWADKYNHIMPTNVISSPYITQYTVQNTAEFQPAGMYNA